MATGRVAVGGKQLWDVLVTVRQSQREGRGAELTAADRKTLIRHIADVAAQTPRHSGPRLGPNPFDRREFALRNYSDETLVFLAALPTGRMVAYDYMVAVGMAQPESFIHALRALNGADFGIPLPALLRGAVLDPVLAPLLRGIGAPPADAPAVASLAAAFTVIGAIDDAFSEERSRVTAVLLALTPAREDRGSVRLARPELTEFVVSRPGDARRIGEIVVERRTDDPAVIEAVLGSASPALQSGAL